MISDAVKLAKIKARAEKDIATMALIKAVASNPVVELLTSAIVIIELPKNGFFPGTFCPAEEALLMAACTAAVGLQQVAPLAPYIAQGTEVLTKAIPGLLSIAAVAGA